MLRMNIKYKFKTEYPTFILNISLNKQLSTAWTFEN